MLRVILLHPYAITSPDPKSEDVIEELEVLDEVLSSEFRNEEVLKNEDARQPSNYDTKVCLKVVCEDAEIRSNPNSGQEEDPNSEDVMEDDDVELTEVVSRNETHESKQ